MALASSPTMPPTACSAKTSIASSMRIQYFTTGQGNVVSLVVVVVVVVVVMAGGGKGEGPGGVFTFCSKIAHDAADDAEYDGSPRREVAGRRCGGNEARNHARAPADHGPLAGEAVIEQDPRCGGEVAGEARVPARHGGAQVGAERGAAVEA